MRAIDPERLWATSDTRQRIARLLLVLSETTETGEPTTATQLAAAEGVGAFHGPPFLGFEIPDRPQRAREFNQALTHQAQQVHGVAPLIGANAECGISYSIGVGGTDVPYPVVLGEQDPHASLVSGYHVGQDLVQHGYTWCFQPVVDVRTSSLDPVIGVRAFGADPKTVGAHGAAYAAGLQQAGVLACAKHFPGHGDATVDSHLGLPTVERSSKDHESIHLPPFREVIEAGVASVMTAHVVLPQQGQTEVATFSSDVNEGMLRSQLGFKGILVSDSLRMKAVSKRFSKAQAVIHALAAGNDIANIKCAPGEVPGLLDELERRIEAGELDINRIFSSFVTVLEAPKKISPQEAPAPVSAYNPVRWVSECYSRGVVEAGDEVTVAIEARGPDTESPAAALAEISQQLGVSFVLSERPTSAAAAHIVLCRDQAGLSQAERQLIDIARDTSIPAGVILGGPRTTVSAYHESLPAVSAPCVDVFAIISRPTAAQAFTEILGIGKDR